MFKPDTNLRFVEQDYAARFPPHHAQKRGVAGITWLMVFLHLKQLEMFPAPALTEPEYSRIFCR